MRTWRIRLRDDGGVALVTALLAMMVVASLATAGFQVAVHNLDQSANDRRGVQAIHSAEAGLDWFLNYLASAPILTPKCSSQAITGSAQETLPSSPTATFTVTATYFSDLAPTAITCPASVQPAAVPVAVKIDSVGTAGGKSRKMESYYGLSATPGQTPLYLGAIFSDSSMTLNGHSTLSSVAPNSADLYSNGPVSLGAGEIVYGNVSTRSTLSMSGGSLVQNDAVSYGTINMSGGGTINGNARSTTADINAGNNSTIKGSATYCTGLAPSTGSPKAGGQPYCDATLPTTKQWGTGTLSFQYIAAQWAGYSVHEATSCADVANTINSITSGNWVIHIASGICNGGLSYGSQTAFAVHGNLAIVSDVSTFSMNSNAGFVNATATNPTLFLMFNVNTAKPCVGTTSISFGSQSTIDPTIQALLYSPCSVSFSAQSTLNGQIVAGGNVSLGAGSNVTSVPIGIPGQNPTGFQESMIYREELSH